MPVQRKQSINLHICQKGVKEQIVEITEAYHFYQLIHNSVQHPSVKVQSICKEITGDHLYGFKHNRSTYYWSYILHLSNI
jgi:cell shape-determining protein MreC